MTPKGAKTFIYKYKIGGQTRWITYGQFPDLSLAEARKKYSTHKKAVENGGDPGQTKTDLNFQTINALAPRKTRFIQWDRKNPGFGVRVTPRGIKTFVFKYTSDGRSRWITYGQFPALSLADARKKYLVDKGAVANGADPGRTKQEDKHQRITNPTGKELVKLFCEGYTKPRPSTMAEYKRTLEVDFVPALGSLKSADINRRDIRNLIFKKAKTAPVAANRLLAAIGVMFTWAIKEEYLDASPCVLIDKPHQEKSRDRVLNNQEIASLMAWSHPSTTNILLKLILLTVKRPGEWRLAKWQHVDFKKQTFFVPAENSKNRHEYLTPLPPSSIKLLKKLPTHSEYIFPGPKTDEPMTKTGVCRFMARHYADMKIEKATPHDLRRTAVTNLAELGTPFHVIKKLEGHKDGSVEAIYNRYDYQPEMKSALRKLENKILTKPAQGKVVSLFG